MKGRANRLFVEETVMGDFVGDGVVMEQRGTIGLRRWALHEAVASGV